MDYAVDADGYVQKNIEITDPEIDTSDPESKCTKPTHTLVLYPVFKKVAVHNFSVTFNLRGGYYLRTLNNAGTSWTTTRTFTYYQPEDGKKVDVDSAVRAKEWTNDNFWKTRGFGAQWYGDMDSNYTYEFAGWTTDKDSKIYVDEGATPNVTWESAGTNYVGDGFIKDTIKAECSNNPCDGGTHNVNLYAIWKRTPRTKTYTLKFNANGGENAPADIVQSDTYNGSWKGYSEFTLTNQQIINAGMKNKKLVFVGWHENKNADQGRFGEKNTTNSELEQLTQILKNPYKFEATGYANEKTLYAIWWFEFNLDYDANGGSNAPEHEHAYTKNPNFPFEISKDKPTHSAGYKFLGWSEEKTTPGQGTEADVQLHPSTNDNKVDWNVLAAGDPSSDEYGYTGKILYAVWGPAN